MGRRNGKARAAAAARAAKQAKRAQNAQQVTQTEIPREAEADIPQDDPEPYMPPPEASVRAALSEGISYTQLKLMNALQGVDTCDEETFYRLQKEFLSNSEK